MSVEELAAPTLAAPASSPAAQLDALASELLQRRDAILDQWRSDGGAAAAAGIESSLSRTQFNDHIPDVLDCFAHTIRAWPGEGDRADAQTQTERVCEHGLQRWQQGYQLRELVREWGNLQICVAEELERYAVAHPSLHPDVMPAARRAWLRLCADGVAESATQYWRLHQTESAGHVHDLEQALSALQALEHARAEAWRVAAHDLRGSVTVVKGATSLLESGSASEDPVRIEVAEMLNTSVASLHEMLNDLLSLARLEAGHEQRTLSRFDAAVLMRDFCAASQTAATRRGLFLKMDGPDTLEVEGDRAKVLRILQNLLLNALKYTQRGGVCVMWGTDRGRDTDRWTFSVQDTGPGIDENHAAPLAQELREATEIANETTSAGADRRRDIAPAVTLRSASAALPQSEQAGEGVGLTIVKRLCELLDAGLELATEAGRGSTFRVILPCRYASASTDLTEAAELTA
jgi:signal transduction histidine kinase